MIYCRHLTVRQLASFACCNLQLSFCNFQFALLFLSTIKLERLRKPELYLPLMQPVDCGGRMRRIQELRNQELRRVQQKAVINRQRAAEWCLEAKPQAHRVTPAHPQVLRVDVFHEISRRRRRLGMKDVADGAEDVAAVIERNYLNIRIDGNACLQVG